MCMSKYFDYEKGLSWDSDGFKRFQTPDYKNVVFGVPFLCMYEGSLQIGPKMKNWQFSQKLL
jgi:hypothetical protein